MTKDTHTVALTTPLKLLCAEESKAELASPSIETSKLAEYAMVGAAVGVAVGCPLGTLLGRLRP